MPIFRHVNVSVHMHAVARNAIDCLLSAALLLLHWCCLYCCSLENECNIIYDGIHVVCTCSNRCGEAWEMHVSAHPMLTRTRDAQKCCEGRERKNIKAMCACYKRRPCLANLTLAGNGFAVCLCTCCPLCAVVKGMKESTEISEKFYALVRVGRTGQ